MKEQKVSIEKQKNNGTYNLGPSVKSHKRWSRELEKSSEYDLVLFLSIGLINKKQCKIPPGRTKKTKLCQQGLSDAMNSWKQLLHYSSLKLIYFTLIVFGVSSWFICSSDCFCTMNYNVDNDTLKKGRIITQPAECVTLPVWTQLCSFDLSVTSVFAASN